MKLEHLHLLPLPVHENVYQNRLSDEVCRLWETKALVHT